MTTHKEALKLALAEFENQKAGLNEVGVTDHNLDDLITTIKEALAKPELCKYGQEPKSCTSSPMDCQCALDATFEQPEQEHVEWGVDWGPDGSSVSIIKRFADGGIEVVGWEYAPHPPKRTWAGLTDEEMHECAGEYPWTPTGLKCCRAIEAKLKEKNT